MKASNNPRAIIRILANACVFPRGPRTDSYPQAYTNRIFKSSWTRWAL